MSGLCDLHDFPADQWVAIATSVRDSVSMPAQVVEVLPPGAEAIGAGSHIEERAA